MSDVPAPRLQRYYYIIRRDPSLGESLLTDQIGGSLYFPFTTNRPFDRGSPEWVRLVNQVYDYYKLWEIQIDIAELLITPERPNQRALVDSDSCWRELADLPLRPITPIAVESPTPTGKQCAHPSYPVPIGFPDMWDGPVEVVMQIDGPLFELVTP